jgi:CDGSH-type Zn-finger protein
MLGITIRIATSLVAKRHLLPVAELQPEFVLRGMGSTVEARAAMAPGWNHAVGTRVAEVASAPGETTCVAVVLVAGGRLLAWEGVRGDELWQDCRCGDSQPKIKPYADGKTHRGGIERGASLLWAFLSGAECSCYDGC